VKEPHGTAASVVGAIKAALAEARTPMKDWDKKLTEKNDALTKRNAVIAAQAEQISRFVLERNSVSASMTAWRNKSDWRSDGEAVMVMRQIIDRALTPRPDGQE